MKISMLLGVALLATLGAMPAGAAEPGQVHLSGYVGQTRLRIDGDRLLDGETVRLDTGMSGVALGYRLPSGLLFEAGLAYAVHDQWFDTDDDFDLYHYSAAAGWQFDLERWRFTPKLGLLRSKLNSEAHLLLNDNGGRTDKVYDTVPFVEASLVHRLGDRWAIGAHFRDTFEEFGHSRSYGFLASLNF
jgi:hypothetical protein